MSAFCDTIRVQTLQEQSVKEGYPIRMTQFIGKLCNGVWARVKAQEGESEYVHMYPGLRQGGRYSTTGGKAVIRSVLEQYELETPEGTGVYWGTSQQMQHVEWADDMKCLQKVKRKLRRMPSTL